MWCFLLGENDRMHKHLAKCEACRATLSEMMREELQKHILYCLAAYKRGELLELDGRLKRLTGEDWLRLDRFYYCG